MLFFFFCCFFSLHFLLLIYTLVNYSSYSCEQTQWRDMQYLCSMFRFFTAFYFLTCLRKSGYLCIQPWAEELGKSTGNPAIKTSCDIEIGNRNNKTFFFPSSQKWIRMSLIIKFNKCTGICLSQNQAVTGGRVSWLKCNHFVGQSRELNLTKKKKDWKLRSNDLILIL